MQANSVSIRRGVTWALEGFTLLRRAPVPLIMIGMLYLCALFLSMIVPLLGQLLPLFLTPILSVGLMHAARMVDERRAPAVGKLYSVLLAGFRFTDRRRRAGLLLLGAINVAAVLGAMACSRLADGGIFFELLTGQLGAADPKLKDPSLRWGALVFSLLYLPSQMALWYAPALTAWEGISPLKSLFFSLVAMMRNKAAFLGYGAAWLAAIMVISLALQLLFLLIGGSGMTVMALISPLLFSAIYCSFWPSYRDVFSRDAAGAAPLPAASV
jgi:hypothetical protein